MFDCPKLLFSYMSGGDWTELNTQCYMAATLLDRRIWPVCVLSRSSVVFCHLRG